MEVELIAVMPERNERDGFSLSRYPDTLSGGALATLAADVASSLQLSTRYLFSS